MIIKKKQINNNLLNLLFKAKTLYGEPFKETRHEIVPFIYGIRHNYSIINLKIVTLFLKRIFKLIKTILKQKKNKILIIGNATDIKFLINKKVTKNNKQVIFFTREWINGFITNKLCDKEMKILLIEKNIKLILIIKSTISDTYLHQELSTLKIPIISILNTSSTLKNINYPIISNPKNVKPLYLILYLLRTLF